MRKLNIAVLALLAALVLPAGAAVAAASGEAASGAAGAGELVVTPETVRIGSGYDGVVLHVAGTVPAGSDVILRFLGTSKDLRMKVKGRALGILWMNLDSLTLHGAPAVALIDSTRPLAQLGPVAAPYGLAQVLRGIGITPARMDKDLYRKEFLKLKHKAGLYGEAGGGVKLGAVKDGRQGFTADVSLPSSLPVGEYRLEAVALKDGAVAANVSRPVPVRFVGVPATMADVAFNHSLLYGILATVVALLGGLIIGLIFQRRHAR